MTEQMQHIPGIVKDIQPIIDNYGYLAVGGLLLLEDFGIPVPGETVLIAASFFAGFGHLNIFAIALVGFIGAVLGDNIGFAIGRYGGHSLVEKYGRYVLLTPPRIAKAKAFFARNGGKVIIVARFISGLRQANGIIAGLTEMRWQTFLFFNVIGAALWVSFWSAVGYYGGSHIDTFLRYQLYATLTVFICIIAFIAYKTLYKRKESRHGKTA